MTEAVAKKKWSLIQVLGDLLSWQFGVLLIQRAGWSGAEPGDVNLAVQDFRRRILAGCLRLNGLDPQALPGLPKDPAAWEPILVAEFLDALRSLASLGSAEDKLTRFAHGQYFKYSRRVALLMGFDKKLPCAYAPIPDQPR